jgi:regulator of replication initiation timing
LKQIKKAMWSRKTKGEDLLLDFASLINKFTKERDDLIKGHGTLLAQIDELKKENSHLQKENKMLRNDLFLLSKNY